MCSVRKDSFNKKYLLKRYLPIVPDPSPNPVIENFSVCAKDLASAMKLANRNVFIQQHRRLSPFV